MADPQQPDFFPASEETPDFIPLNQDTLAAHAQNVSADPFAAGRARVALSSIKPPANPISAAEPNVLPMAGQAVSDVFQGAGQMALGAGRDLWDTSLGSILNAYNRGYGPPVTPQQLEAHARLKAAGKNAMANYALGGLTGEAGPNLDFLKRKPNMTGALLNASGDVSPETLANIKAVQPQLTAAGPPAVKTQTGMANHLKGLSMDIQNQIAPIVEQNAGKDVSASMNQMATDLRSEITPAMKQSNPRIANILKRFANTAEETKTLGQLDDFRKQLEFRRDALQPGELGTPHVYNTLNSVLDTIAGHVQELRPDMDVRALRSTQKNYMQLANTFKEAGAKGEAIATSQAAMTPRQKFAQLFPSVIEAATNRKAFIARQLAKPATAEEMIQRAYAGQPQSAAGQMVRSVAGPGMDPLEMDQILRRPPEGTADAVKQALQNLPERRGLRQLRPDLFPEPAAAPPVAGPTPEAIRQADAEALSRTSSGGQSARHTLAFQIAKEKLGGTASLSDIMAEADRIEREGRVP